MTWRGSAFVGRKRREWATEANLHAREIAQATQTVLTTSPFDPAVLYVRGH